MSEDQENCSVCGEPWSDHEFGVPHPSCPKEPLPGRGWYVKDQEPTDMKDNAPQTKAALKYLMAHPEINAEQYLAQMCEDFESRLERLKSDAEAFENLHPNPDGSIDHPGHLAVWLVYVNGRWVVETNRDQAARVSQLGFETIRVREVSDRDTDIELCREICEIYDDYQIGSLTKLVRIVQIASQHLDHYGQPTTLQ